MENNKKHQLSNEELQKTFTKLHGEGKNVQFVDLDDEFEFSCSRCGGCCTNRDDILVSPYDVYNLAVALNKTGQEIATEYLDIYIGHHSHLPVAVIADTPQHKCPFLEFDPMEMLYKCKVNDHKPGPCRTHPFGIVRQMSDEAELDSIHFIRTDFCNNHHEGNKITVREYIGEDYLNSLDDRKLSYKLQSFVAKLLNLEKIHAIIRGDESFEGFNDKEKTVLAKLTESSKEMITGMYMIPYLEAVYNFNPNESFSSQCEKGFKDVIKSSIDFRMILAVLGFDVGPTDESVCEKIVNQYMTDEDLAGILDKLTKSMEKADEKIKEKLKELESDVNSSRN